MAMRLCRRPFSDGRRLHFAELVVSGCDRPPKFPTSPKRRNLAAAVPNSISPSGHYRTVEQRWRAFFSNPSHWWDHRSEKTNPKYPDFTHKTTREPLWLSGRSNPRWVQAELAALGPSVPAQKNLFSWNGLLAKHVKKGENQITLELFQKMQQQGISPDRYTFVPVLKAIAGLGAGAGTGVGAAARAMEEGTRLHARIVQRGCQADPFVGSSLIDMYAKCGNIDAAWSVFVSLPSARRDVVVWTAMIKGFVKCRQGQKALDLFREMCSVAEGRRRRTGECEGESESESEGEVVKVEPNPVTLVGVLNACASVGDVEVGRRVHEMVIRRGFESDSYICSSLIDMYAKCGSIEDAAVVFQKWPTRDLVSWNTMIMAYAKCGQGQKALALYRQMEEEEEEVVVVVVVGEDEEKKGGGGVLRPNLSTLKGVLVACAGEADLEEGRRVHSRIAAMGGDSDMYVASSLVDMYAKCGSVEDALREFEKMPVQDSVSWNAIVVGFVKSGKGRKALELSRRMMEERGIDPNASTFVGLLNFCADAGELDEGRRLHKHIVECGLESDLFVASSLVDMYAKCCCEEESMEEAWTVFSKMPRRDVVVWTAMIKGYVKCGRAARALELFHQMQKTGKGLGGEVKPDRITFVAALNACAAATALEEGKSIHTQIIESGCESDLFVGNALIDMYAKCGSIEEAQRAFENMPVRDVVSWNSLLGGHAMHGHAKEALQLLERMHREEGFKEGIRKNEVTFVCLLSACSHAGLVDEGIHLFQSMESVYGVRPTAAHYACAVDILCRAGHLQEAEEMVRTMPCQPDVSVWKALLGACRVHGNVVLGEVIAKRVLELDPQNASGYVLLSNIYAAAGDWDSSAALQRFRKERGVRKQPGCTWIAVDQVVHSFTVNDRAHPEIEKIHAELRRLSGEMKEAGYVPDTSFALHDVEDEEKVGHLGHHSEKLAIAYGLLRTPGETTPICIYKNLRVCGDCHNATKVISKIANREIIVRDSNRFHHFKDGLCSCGDYW